MYRQAGRLVGRQRQRGEPVQSHEGEEAGVVDWVLLSGEQRGEERGSESDGENSAVTHTH